MESDNTDCPMTVDYAKLSMLTGMFAAQADTHLGGHEFQTKIREEAWNLSWEKLVKWKIEAIERGVPVEVFELPSMVKERLSFLIGPGIRLQRMLDVKRSNGKLKLCGRCADHVEYLIEAGFSLDCSTCGGKGILTVDGDPV